MSETAITTATVGTIYDGVGDGKERGAGETIPLAPKDLLLLSPEIEWGQNYRKRAKAQKHNTINPKSAPEYTQKCSKKLNVWRPEFVVNKNVKQLFEEKLLYDSKVVNRSALSTRQHIKLLAEPKRGLYVPPGKRLTRRCLRNCTPRLAQLSVPVQRRVFATWNDYQETLPVAKIDMLSNIFNTNLSLELPDAEKCFEQMKADGFKDKKKRDKKKKLQSLRKEKKLRVWIDLKSYYFAIIFAEYLCNNSISHLSHYQRKIASNIATWMVKFHLVKSIKFKKKNVYKEGLLTTMDKCAIFAYNILAAAETSAEKSMFQPDSMYDGDSTITPIESTLESTIESTQITQIICVPAPIPEEYSEKYSDMVPAELSPSAQLAAAELELMKLCELLTQFYENRFDLHGEPIFSDPNLPQVTLDKLLMDIVGIAESREIVAPHNRLRHAFQRKITNYTRETNPEALSETMTNVIDFVSTQLAKSYISEMLKEDLLEVEDEGPDICPELLYFTDINKKTSAESESIKENTVLSAKESSLKSAIIEPSPVESLSVAVTTGSSTILSEAEAEPLPLAEPLDITSEKEVLIIERPKVDVMPHSPNMVCCASLKAWASWIKEVIENAKMWCFWINQTIRYMRRMAAIMKGTVFDDNGQVVTLSRNEWNEFVMKLDRDIVAWRHYNQHVQEITEAILSHYNDKRVACCALCLQEDLYLSEIGADHICEQLHEALQTTLYWRRWLHSMVSEAEALTTLIDEADVATLIDVTSSTELLAIAGATIITNRPTDGRSSSTSSSSGYSIRAINPPSQRHHPD